MPYRTIPTLRWSHDESERTSISCPESPAPTEEDGDRHPLPAGDDAAASVCAACWAY